MATLREWIAQTFLKNEVVKLTELTEAFVDAYQRRPAPNMSPEAYIAQLGEVDERYIDLLLRQIRERDYSATDESMRLAAVRESRSLYFADPVTGTILDLWTDYGFGVRVDVTPRDEAAQKVWQEFWSAARNAAILSDRVIHELSTNLLQDGEFYFVFFVSRTDGAVTVRTVPTDEIREVVTDAADKSTALFYKRTFTGNDSQQKVIYYKNFMALPADIEAYKLPEGSVRADQINTGNGGKTGTDVFMLQVAYRRRSNRGWPLMTAGAPWSRAYKNFLQDRAAVARAVATYVDKIKADGGQRAIDMITRRLQSSLTQSGSGAIDTNPVPAAGSTWVENQAVSRERMSLQTGASDAEKDGAPLLAQAGLAGRIYPHFLGRGETYRLATATAMEEPVKRAFNRYQLFWSSIWQDMVKLVLTASNLYGGTSFTDMSADVNQDAILQIDMVQLTAFMNQLTNSSQAGLVDSSVAAAANMQLLRVALQTLGVSGVQDVLDAKAEKADSRQLAAVAAALAEMQIIMLQEARTLERYKSLLRQPFYGLWRGELDETGFQDAMEVAIRYGLRDAFIVGAEDVGIEEEALEAEELMKMNTWIYDEFAYIQNVARFIMNNNKASETRWSVVEARMQLWLNRWNDIRNRAKLLVGKNKKLEWQLGATEEHCNDCLKYNGKVKRASYWDSLGVRPQSEVLECHGNQCLCQLVPTDAPLTRGNLPKPTNASF